MKSFTDIEQSRRLAEILPIESADMWYLPIKRNEKVYYDLTVHCSPTRGIIPAWSLSALLSILPSVIKRKGKRMYLTLEKAGAYNLYYKSPDRLDELWETKEEPVDTCYNMIVKLKEMKLL